VVAHLEERMRRQLLRLGGVGARIQSPPMKKVAGTL
jgi:hypothetical protein